MGISKKLASTISAFFLLVGVISINLSSGVSAAGNATLSLTLSNPSPALNSTFTVTVYENSGNVGVNAIQADLTYNTSQLQLIPIKAPTSGDPDLAADISTSAFPLQGKNSGGNGVVNLGVGSTTVRTGSQKVAVITFRAIVAGSGSINFAGSSAIVNAANQNNELGTAAGSTFTIPKPATGSSPTPTPKSTSTTAPRTSTSTPNTSPSVSSTSNNTTNPVPTNQSDVQGASANRYLLAIKVLDENNKIVVGAKVTLDGITEVSDTTGIASFFNVSAGDHTLKTTVNGKTKSQVINVKGVSTSIPEEFSIQLPTDSFLKANMQYIALAVGALIVLILIWVLWRKLRTPKDHHMDGAPIVSGPVSGSDSAMPPPMPNVSPINNQNIGTVYQPVKSNTVASTIPPQNNDSTTGAK